MSNGLMAGIFWMAVVFIAYLFLWIGNRFAPEGIKPDEGDIVFVTLWIAILSLFLFLFWKTGHF